MDETIIYPKLPDAVLRRNDPGQAGRVARSILEEATRENNLRRVVQALHVLISCALSARDQQQAAELLTRAQSIARQIGDRDLIVIGISINMSLLQLQGNAEEAIDISRYAFDVIGEADISPYARTQLLVQTGVTYAGVSAYGRALTYFFEALQYEGETDNAVLRGLILANIGGVYRHLYYLDLSLEYQEQALVLLRQCGDRQGEVRALHLMGYAYLELNRIEPAIATFEEALRIARAISETGVEGQLLSGLGNAYEMLGELDRAFEYDNQALEIADRMGDRGERVNSLTYLASVQIARKDYESAQAKLQEALALAQEIDDPMLQWKPHELLATLFESTGDPSRALHHFRQFVMIREELFGHKQHQEAVRTQAESERKILEQERENHRLKALTLEKDLEYQTNQMTLLTTSLIQKRESLEKIQKDLRLMAESDRISNGKLNGLLEKIEEMMRSEQDWQAFERHFHHLHQGFIHVLAEQYPSLTPTELKVCSLLKTNCSTKDIAGILCISRYTVDGHRATIRRKLGLATEENLTAFLARIENG